MAERVENLKLKSVLLNNDSDGDESKEDKGDIPGLSLEKLNLGPAKKLLVLNVCGLLCDRVFYKDEANMPRGVVADVAYGFYLLYKRPHCEDFLKFCFQRFEVGIWSSAKKQDLSVILDCVMEEYRSKLLFVWDQEHCTDSGFRTLENEFEPIFFQELKNLWDSPKCSGKYSPENTLMITDRPYKAFANHPYTAIFPEVYKATNVTDTALGANGELRLYLEGLADADDVPTYVKEHPFGQPEITAEHPDLRYYSHISFNYHLNKPLEDCGYNIHGALACVIGELKSKLLFIWDQNDCTDSGFKTLDKRDKPLFLKELKKLWESPLCRGKYSLSNTLMIDDKPHKALLNPPHTAIFPVTYTASHATDTALGPKGVLRLYLDGVAEADNVPSYVKEHPFGQSAITAAHPDWDYYSKIVDHLGKKSEDDFCGHI